MLTPCLDARSEQPLAPPVDDGGSAIEMVAKAANAKESMGVRQAILELYLLSLWGRKSMLKKGGCGASIYAFQTYFGTAQNRSEKK